MKSPVKHVGTKNQNKNQILADQDTVVQIFERLKKINPAPKTELHYKNPYTLVVAVTLSAQATDISVNKATEKFFPQIDTPEKMLALGEEGLKEYIKTIGLYNGKARNIIAMSKMLIEKFGGKVPQTLEELQSLPGVGRKTANVILNEAFGVPTIAVDTHVFRVAQRLNLAHGKTPDQIEEGLMKIIPDKYKRHAHHWLILHGRYVCTARKPNCKQCVLQELCPYPDKNFQ